MSRDFRESEKEARRRAERDWATRDRIAYAHEHLGEALGVSPEMSRRATKEGMRWTADAVHRAGLTLGEAKAAGIRVAS